jgi:hypothetical protein
LKIEQELRIAGSPVALLHLHKWKEYIHPDALLTSSFPAFSTT